MSKTKIVLNWPILSQIFRTQNDSEKKLQITDLRRIKALFFERNSITTLKLMRVGV
jgi:hypothetical protein